MYAKRSSSQSHRGINISIGASYYRYVYSSKEERISLIRLDGIEIGAAL